MTKSRKVALNTITLILFNLLFWACNRYPKHIVGVLSDHSAWAILFNLVYFVILDCFLIIVFSQNKTFFSERILDKTLPVSKRFQLGKLITLLLMQLVVDGLMLLFNKIAVEWAYVGMDLLIVLHWFAVYMLLADKTVAIWKRPAFIAGCLAIAAVFLGIAIGFDFAWLQKLEMVSSKYELASPVLLSANTEMQFGWEVKALILDTVVGLLLVWFHILNSKNEELPPDYEISRGKMASSLCVQILVILNVAILMMVFKFAVWPDATLQGMRGHNARHGWEKHDFYVEFSEYELIRKGRHGSESICHTTNSYHVVVNQDERILIQSCSKWPYDYYAKDGELVKCDTREKLDIGEKEAYLFCSKVIGFYDNDMPRAIRLEEISGFEPNDMITAICERLLFEGNIYVFEYAVDYLIENDTAFIMPYIERYAEGHFTDIEKEWMEKNFYKGEYVVSIAKEVS